jgi:hypothetical protein
MCAPNEVGAEFVMVVEHLISDDPPAEDVDENEIGRRLSSSDVVAEVSAHLAAHLKEFGDGFET